LDVLELVVLHKGRVGSVAGVNLALVGAEMANHVLAAKAVADSAEFLAVISVLERSQYRAFITLTPYFCLISMIHESMIGST
jgi:hypothetical protein